jgi:uncharacterized membrane protein
MTHLIAQIFIGFLSLAGLILSIYIFRKKRRKETMVCPLGSDCDAVIHSQYAKFLGVPVETLGIFYYGVSALIYAGFLLSLIPYTPLSSLIAVITTSLAFLFSTYLIFIQAFVLRQWCTWCLTSAALCTGIFLAAASSAILPNVLFFHTAQPLLTSLQIIAIAVGVGTATIIEIFFLKFLKDSKLSINESDILHTLAEIIWIALAIALLTQVGIYLGSDMPEITTSLKNIVIFIIIINGAFLHPLLTPKLLRVSSGENHKHTPGELHRLRKLAFTLCATSVASWYFLAMLGFILKTNQLNLYQLLGTYLAILITILIINHLLDLIFSRQKDSTTIHGH